MSDEAEKAEIGEAVIEFRKTKDKLIALETRTQALAQVFETFGSVLKNPGKFVFDTNPTTITVGISGGNLQRPHARITQADLRWDDLCKLIADYQDTLRNHNAWAVKLRNAGLANL
jgi:hypothetical protein